MTYHGPGQLVAYPILDLLRYRQSLLWYTETLASVMSDAVKTVCKLDAYFDKCPDRVGLWFSQNGTLPFVKFYHSFIYLLDRKAWIHWYSSPEMDC